MPEGIAKRKSSINIGIIMEADNSSGCVFVEIIVERRRWARARDKNRFLIIVIYVWS